MRSYQDGCAAAHALDIVGERWALLVVRELVLGPKRFTDLRTGLPKASPNVLSQRLRELEHSGVVRKRKLPPPAASQVYELTEWGAELEPILSALGRWGVRSPTMPFTTEIGTDSLIIALRTMFVPDKATTAAIQLWFGHDHFRALIESGSFEIERGEFDEADATVETDAETLKHVALGKSPVDSAIDDGKMTIYGDRGAVERFFARFQLPVAIKAA
nr:winged helix-turn-helix transcriptional regulator [Stackebrandtia nassauensis]